MGLWKVSSDVTPPNSACGAMVDITELALSGDKNGVPNALCLTLNVIEVILKSYV
jgi:hypothetical protein